MWPSECTANAWRAVAALVLVVDLPDFGIEHGVVDGAGAWLRVQPLVVAAPRDPEDSARPGHRNAIPLRVNELVHGYFTSLAKRAAAFFRSEFSACRSRSARRSRSTSSRSP